MSGTNAGSPPVQAAKREKGRVRVLEPTRGWRALDASEIWQYRDLMWMLMVRDMKVRYRQTALGVLWAIARPMAMIVTFTLIFGKVMRVEAGGVPYALFAVTGLLPWTFFASAVSSSTSSLLSSAPLLTKIYFPRLIIPLAAIGAGVLDLVISMALLAPVMWFYRTPATARLMSVPLLIVALVLVSAAVGILLSAATVQYRDFALLVPFLVQLWLYATPVIYPLTLLGSGWQRAIHINPMTGVVQIFRAVILGTPFDAGGLVVSASVTIAVLVLGLVYFARVERRFADIV